MSEKKFFDALESLREEQEENAEYFNNGKIEEFFDFLEPSERESFEEVKNLAEEKKKWLRLFQRMMKQIEAREFEEAVETFEALKEEICI